VKDKLPVHRHAPLEEKDPRSCAQGVKVDLPEQEDPQE
jgi:hypothetical protein